VRYRNGVLKLLAVYDARRDRWQARPIALGLLMLALVACAVAGLLALRGLTGRVSLAAVPPEGTGTSPHAAGGAEAAQPPPSNVGAPEAERPLTWQVWSLPDGRHDLPSQVQAFACQDLERALAWWQANLRHPDALGAGLPVYFSGAELARRRQSVQDCRRYDAVGIVYAEPLAPDGDGAHFLDVDRSGRRVLVSRPHGQRHAALYRLSDGALVPGSETVLPAAHISYRLVFDAESRHWRVDDQVGMAP